jgi:hypothetical protein
MHLLAISLLTILAGTLLLAKFKKEMAGKFFVFISWFFIVVGFILFIGFIGGAIYKLKYNCYPYQTGFQHPMMMKNRIQGMQNCCSMQGMDKGGCCCMGGMDKGSSCCAEGMGHGMCGGMPQDSMMKCCPGGMKGDTVKMQVPGK